MVKKNLTSLNKYTLNSVFIIALISFFSVPHISSSQATSKWWMITTSYLERKSGCVNDCPTRIEKKFYYGTAANAREEVERIKSSSSKSSSNKIEVNLVNINDKAYIGLIETTLKCNCKSLRYYVGNSEEEIRKSRESYTGTDFVSYRIVRLEKNENVSKVTGNTKSSSFSMTQDTKEGIDRVKDILESAEILNAVLAITVFNQLFAQGNAIKDPLQSVSTINDVSTQDWEANGSLLKNVNAIYKKALRDECNHNILVHEGLLFNSNGKKVRDPKNKKLWEEFKKITY